MPLTDLSDFTAFYPQFEGFTPETVVAEYLRQANARFSDFGIDADEARRLFTAHRLTLYSRTALPEGSASPTYAVLASAGEKRSEVSSKKVGEVQVSYSTAASASGTAASFADLPETVYGLQLLSLIRLYRTTRYIP